MKLKCPLCKQEVSKRIYEDITGIWKEKEQKLTILKAKEKKLIEKEKKMKAENKKEIENLILKQSKERLKIEREFRSKLSKNTNKIKKDEERRHKKFMEKERKNIQKQAEAEKRKQLDRYGKLNKQLNAHQQKSQKDLDAAKEKIKKLNEQIEKNQTPQMLGILNEKDFLVELKKHFPNDKFEHTGKGGDILHNIIEKNKEIGRIVYELKKVSRFNKTHIKQTLDAKNQRVAHYGILVTNKTSNKNNTGFRIEKGIIIIHPAGAISLIKILRNSLVDISGLQLSVQQKNKKIQDVLEYIQSPRFKNGIETIINNAVELHGNLQKEVKMQIKSWQFRFEKYKQINSEAHKIDRKAVKSLSSEKASPEAIEISAISLPAKLK